MQIFPALRLSPPAPRGFLAQMRRTRHSLPRINSPVGRLGYEGARSCKCRREARPDIHVLWLAVLAMLVLTPGTCRENFNHGYNR